MSPKNKLRLVQIIILLSGALLFVFCIFHKSSLYRMEHFGSTKGPFTWTQEMYDSVGLHSLEYNKKPFYLRWLTESGDVDVWSDDQVHFHEQVYAFNNEARNYCRVYALPDKSANEIATSFNTLKIGDILSEANKQNHSCMPIELVSYEFVAADRSLKKILCCPHPFNDSEKEAKTIDSFTYCVKANAGLLDD